MAARFLIRKDAVLWFKHLEPYLKERATAPTFELYYFCVLAGLATNRAPAQAGETADLIEAFPTEYSHRGRLIVGLFLARQVKHLGIAPHERQSLHDAIRDYVDHLSPSQLSDKGMRQLNQYGYGGFDQLLEWFPERPTDLETFIPVFKEKISAAART